MKKFNIVYLGVSGFPHLKSATVHKIIYLNKILNAAGFNTLVINNEALLTKTSENIPLDGIFEKTSYHYTIRNPYTSASPITKRIQRKLGLLNEFFFLLRYKFSFGIGAAIIVLTDSSIIKLVYYRLLSKILNFKLLLIYHEFRSEFDNRKSKILTTTSDKLFDNYSSKFVDAILPISEFLITHTKSISPQKPIFKLPPLIDFSLFNTKIKKKESLYFLFCGSAGYTEIIEFIIHSFERTKSDSGYSLNLVLSGNKYEINYFKEFVAKSKFKNKIFIYSDLSFENLISMYQGSSGLLIPLRPDIRDLARFPQKIAEYTASGSPIISTNIGEVKNYFRDGINALLAEKYNVDQVAEKLNFVINNPITAAEIGLAGKEIGRKHFDYNNYIESLRKFIVEIL